MAFGKKKPEDDSTAQAPEDVTLSPSDTDGGAPIDGQLFAAPDAEGDAQADGASAAPEAVAEPAEAAAPAADPLGGADLLSMFQTTQVESDDKAALLELAGEVEVHDLLEDLQTVAAAMGIRA
jgi:hypothetical protein